MLQQVATPGSLSEIHSMLSEPGGRIMAGGTVVMPEYNYGTDAFTRLVSLRRAGLAGIESKGGTVTIGAATTLAEIEENGTLAFLRPALDTIASPTIRNMATVGGNLFAKQPYGDFAACLIALDARATVSGSDGKRDVAVEELVREKIAGGEVVTAVSLAIPASDSFRFAKAGRKALNAAAIVTVAAVVEARGGAVSDCRIALGGVAPHAVRARSVEAALTGKPFDRENVAAAAAEAGRDIDPSDDAHASAWYRARVTPVHIRRALIGE